MPRWLRFAVAFAVLAAALGSWIAFGASRPPDVHVVTAPVTVGPVARRLVATGTLDAVTTVDVGTQVSGFIQSLGTDYDQIVRAGQVVARIDPSIYQADAAAARAALEQARSNVGVAAAGVRDAQEKLTRVQALAKDRLETQADLDAARTAFREATATRAAAAASVTQAQAALATARVDLDHTIIRSPVTGVVVARNVEVGQTVAATLQSPTLFTIADLRHMQLEADIDESDVGSVHAGERATFTVDAYPGQTFDAVVSQVRLQPESEQTSAGTGVATPVGTVVRYTTILSVDNADERLRPGMTATLVLTTGERDAALRVPNDALAFRPANDVLDALGERPPASSPAQVPTVWRDVGGRLEPTRVRVGLVGQQYTQLVGGALHAGDHVVTSALIPRAGFLSARSPLVPERPRFRRFRR